MRAVNLDYFLPPIEDKELNQYRILAQLKEYANLFHKNKLYPALAQLNQIDNLLNSLLYKYANLQISVSNQMNISSIKTENVDIDLDDDSSDKAVAVDLIKWAKPLVRSTMSEGLAIYEFVYDNIIIDSVGPLPSFKDAGYFVVPDYRSSQLLLIEYICSIFTSNNKPVKSLKTRLITQVTLENINTSITETGLNLIARYGDLVNPAIFICKTDLDFPFAETIFPIAKSKLLSLLSVE